MILIKLDAYPAIPPRGYFSKSANYSVERSTVSPVFEEADRSQLMFFVRMPRKTPQGGCRPAEKASPHPGCAVFRGKNIIEKSLKAPEAMPHKTPRARTSPGVLIRLSIVRRQFERIAASSWPAAQGSAREYRRSGDPGLPADFKSGLSKA